MLLLLCFKLFFHIFNFKKGLGTARVKCLVHNDFRLIVVADKKSVYNPKKYPIPLVNRLEKHLLSIDAILNDNMKKIVQSINKWLEQITSTSEKYAYKVKIANGKQNLKPMDIFVGLTEDTVSSLVYKFSKEHNYESILNTDTYMHYEDASKNTERDLIKLVQEYLLQSCSSDGIIRLLNNNLMSDSLKSDSVIDVDSIIDIYFNQQAHENFAIFFKKNCLYISNRSNFVQITTHSRLLSKSDIEMLQWVLNCDVTFKIESLLSFDTQQQFVHVLKEFFELNSNEKCDKTKHVLIIQCDCAHLYADLINCARFTIIDEFSKYNMSRNNFSIILVVQIPKIAGGCISGFQSTKWLCYHVDDLQNNFYMDNILNYKDKSLSEIFADGLKTDENEADELSTRNFMFMITLLKSAMYNSCSKVVDMINNTSSAQRSIERIEILLRLLNFRTSADDTSFNLGHKFCAILLKYITRLQTERENTLSSVKLSKQWVFNEVSKISNVIKYGTLKNSCINYIETRLTSLFSGK